MGDAISPGQALEVAFDGLRISATVAAIADQHIELTIPLKLPASSFVGVLASVAVTSERTVEFDLGSHANFTELRVVVPWREPDVVPAAADLGEGALPEHPLARQGATDSVTGTVQSAVDGNPGPGGAEAAGQAGGAETPAAEKLDEKRQYYRLMVKVGVEVFDDSLARKPSVVGQTVNLSGGGMLIALDKPLRPRVYHFRVHVPGDRLDLKGMVLLRKGLTPGFTAINFVGITEGLRGRIIRFIFARLRSLRDDPTGVVAASEPTRANGAAAKVSARERRSLRLEGRLELSRHRRRR